MNFNDKYIKYKLKYINLKKNIEQVGGVGIVVSNKQPIITIVINDGQYNCKKLVKFIKANDPQIPIINCTPEQNSTKKFQIRFETKEIANDWLEYIKQIVTDTDLDYYNTEGKLRVQPQPNIIPSDIARQNTNLINTTEEQADIARPNTDLVNTTEEQVDIEVPPSIPRSNGGFTDAELDDILNSNGRDNNFLTGEPNSKNYTDNIPKWKHLPLYNTDKVKEFIDLLDKNQVILLTSGTGSGKTVLVPKLVLAYNMKNGITGKIGITNPKILTTVSNAQYAAETLDVQVGDLVSYSHKGSKARIDKIKTKLIYQTDGILLASSIRDGIDYDTIIIDEAHERNVSIDFLLLLLKNHVLTNPSFKLIIMSATINAEVFKTYFNVADIKFGSIHISSTPNFAIAQHYLEKPIPIQQRKNKLAIVMQKLFTILTTTKTGDILIFVATVKETLRGCEELKKICSSITELNKYKITQDICNNSFCIELFANIDNEQKELAVNKDKYRTKDKKYLRKVIFATNVAESSLTIDGLTYVIDVGDELKTYYNYFSNQDVLAISRTSKAQVKQRIGRTGRTGPGIAYHMYTEEEYNKVKGARDDENDIFNEYPKTKIESEDIINTILELINVEKSISGMIDKIQKLITVPNIYKIVNCIYRLYLLDCIKIDSLPDDWSEYNTYEKLQTITGKITNMGKSILKFRSVPLECAYAMILGKYYNCLNEIIIIMAMLQEKLNDLFIDTAESNLKRFTSGYFNNSSEHITLLNIFRDLHKNGTYGKCLNQSTFKKVDKTIKTYTEYCKRVDVNNGSLKFILFNGNGKDPNDRIKFVLAQAYMLNILEINKDGAFSKYFIYYVEKQMIKNLFTSKPSNIKYVVCHSYLNIFGSSHFRTSTDLSEDMFEHIINSSKEDEPELNLESEAKEEVVVELESEAKEEFDDNIDDI